jgi:hypothetical protein
MNHGETNKLTASGHEPIETDVRAVWRTAGALAGVVVATFVLIIFLMKWLGAAEERPAATFAASSGAGPDEQVSLQQLRVQEQKMLDTYEWVDQTSGIARIPVGRAIEIISANGLPAALQGLTAPESARTEQTTSSGSSPANVGGDEQ